MPRAEAANGGTSKEELPPTAGALGVQVHDSPKFRCPAAKNSRDPTWPEELPLTQNPFLSVPSQYAYAAFPCPRSRLVGDINDGHAPFRINPDPRNGGESSRIREMAMKHDPSIPSGVTLGREYLAQGGCGRQGHMRRRICREHNLSFGTVLSEKILQRFLKCIVVARRESVS